MTRVFISYRRADSQIWADRIYPVLVKAFGKENVFKDIDSISAGQNFRAAIEKAIIQSDVVLILIGRQWVTITDDQGRKRLDNPDDAVRLEVEMALRHANVVIPVVVDAAQVPSSSDLPPSFNNLPFLNGANIRHDPDFDHDMTRLIRAIRERVGGTTPLANGRSVSSLRTPVIVGTIILILILLGLALLNRQLPSSIAPTLTQQIGQIPTDFPTITNSLVPTLSSTEVEGTIQGEMDVAQTDIANTQSAVIALKTANAVSTDARSAIDKTGTVAQWTSTPTLNARATALERITETQAALGTQSVFSQTATAASWTNTLTLTSTPAITSSYTSSPTMTPTPLGGSNQIAFTSNRDGNNEIYVMNIDGTHQYRLTNNSNDDSNPVWSPDGNYLAFVSHRDGNYQIYSMNADGTNIRRLTNNSYSNSSPAWSPDGKKIAFSSLRDGRSQIYIMDTNGNNVTQITNNDNWDSDYPSWSPNGRQFAYISSPIPMLTGYKNSVNIVEVSGENNRTIISGLLSQQLYSDWSPKLDLIAMTFGQVLSSSSTLLEISDTTGVRLKVINSLGHLHGPPHWSPDGKWIVVSVQKPVIKNNNGNPTPDINIIEGLTILDSNFENIQHIPNTSKTDFFPAWRPK